MSPNSDGMPLAACCQRYDTLPTCPLCGRQLDPNAWENRRQQVQAQPASLVQQTVSASPVEGLVPVNLAETVLGRSLAIDLPGTRPGSQQRFAMYRVLDKIMSKDEVAAFIERNTLPSSRIEHEPALKYIHQHKMEPAGSSLPGFEPGISALPPTTLKGHNIDAVSSIRSLPSDPAVLRTRDPQSAVANMREALQRLTNRRRQATQTNLRTAESPQTDAQAPPVVTSISGTQSGYTAASSPAGTSAVAPTMEPRQQDSDVSEQRTDNEDIPTRPLLPSELRNHRPETGIPKDFDGYPSQEYLDWILEHIPSSERALIAGYLDELRISDGNPSRIEYRKIYMKDKRINVMKKIMAICYRHELEAALSTVESIQKMQEADVSDESEPREVPTRSLECHIQDYPLLDEQFAQHWNEWAAAVRDGCDPGEGKEKGQWYRYGSLIVARLSRAVDDILPPGLPENEAMEVRNYFVAFVEIIVHLVFELVRKLKDKAAEFESRLGNTPVGPPLPLDRHEFNNSVREIRAIFAEYNEGIVDNLFTLQETADKVLSSAVAGKSYDAWCEVMEDMLPASSKIRAMIPRLAWPLYIMEKMDESESEDEIFDWAAQEAPHLSSDVA